MKLDRQRLKSLGILLLIGFAYYLETQTLGFRLGCPLYQFTGLRCPACGLTRACIAFLQLRFADAAGANWGLTLSLPVLLPWLAVVIYRWLYRRPAGGKGTKAAGMMLIGWYILWGIGRNFLGL